MAKMFLCFKNTTAIYCCGKEEKMRTIMKTNKNPQLNISFITYILFILFLDSTFNSLRAENENKIESRKNVRILSIDGGRGIIPAVFLKDLEKRTGKKVSEMFDVIIGTGIGGLSALYLTTPHKHGGVKYTARDLVNFYKTKSNDLYYTDNWHSFWNGYGYLGSSYKNTEKEKLMEEIFGNQTFSSTTTQSKVFVPGIDLERDKPVFLSNVKASKSQIDYEYGEKGNRDYQLKDLAMSITTTPTYHKPVKLQSLSGDEKGIVDGSIIINNPTVSGILKAKSLFPEAESFTVVSLGTGTQLRDTSFKTYQSKGFFGWGSSIVPIMTRGISDISDENAKGMLNLRNGQDSYYRLQTGLTKKEMKIDTTDEEHMNALIQRAEKTIKEKSKLFDEIAEKLTLKSKIISNDESSLDENF